MKAKKRRKPSAVTEIFNETGLHSSIINALTALNFYLRKNQKKNEKFDYKKLPLQILVSFRIHFFGFEFGFLCAFSKRIFSSPALVNI